MFKRVTLLYSLAAVLLTFLWIKQFCFVRPSDYEKYREVARKLEIATASKADPTSTNQKRNGVRKDIWFAQEDHTRLQYRIESISSTLTLLPNGKKYDAVENLEKMRCWMQEKLFFTSPGENPVQQMRYFEADQGSYQFNTQQFLASQVALSLFRLPGHALPFSQNPNTAFLRGIAKDVSFSISGKNPQFQAQQFKATLKQHEPDHAKNS